MALVCLSLDSHMEQQQRTVCQWTAFIQSSTVVYQQCSQAQVHMHMVHRLWSHCLKLPVRAVLCCAALFVLQLLGAAGMCAEHVASQQ